MNRMVEIQRMAESLHRRTKISRAHSLKNLHGRGGYKFEQLSGRGGGLDDEMM